MKGGERPSDMRIAKAGEPGAVIGRQSLKVAADSIHEHELADAVQNPFTPRRNSFVSESAA
jgi:hypothetical protein